MTRGQGPAASRVRRVQDYVRRNLQAALGLEELAEVAGVTRFHFARIFKAETGETLNRFVRRARLERAAALMRARPLLGMSWDQLSPYPSPRNFRWTVPFRSYGFPRSGPSRCGSKESFPTSPRSGEEPADLSGMKRFRRKATTLHPSPA